MALTPEQIQQIDLISDTVLYPDAVAFIRLGGNDGNWLKEYKDKKRYLAAISLMQKLMQMALMQKLVKEDEDVFDPLPNNQIMGLLNVAEISLYAEMYQFVEHQRGRTWSSTKQGIRTFYIYLEQYLKNMSNQRVRNEFQLVTGNAVASEMSELMAALTQNFIQHLVAENSVFAAEIADRRERT